MDSGPASSNIQCRVSGHDEHSGFPRFAEFLGPVTVVMWPLAVVAMFVAPSPHSWWPAVVALGLTNAATGSNGAPRPSKRVADMTTALVATWSDGVFVIGDARAHELAGQLIA